MKSIKALIFLLIISFATGVSAQSSYGLLGCDLKFSSAEDFEVVNYDPGFAVYDSPEMEVTLSLIRFLDVNGIENELSKRFSSGDFTVFETSQVIQTNNKKGAFSYAYKKRESFRYAKGLITKGDKTILVEIKYNPSKEKQVKDIVNSFFLEISESSPELDSNSDSTLQSPETNENDEDEYIQKFDYPTFTQVKEPTIEPSHREDPPQAEKHPRVEHTNLIQLTQSQKQEFLDAHNKWRADVGVPPLVWSNDLENYAGEWAIINGKKNCKMQHRDKTPYGENLYWSSGMAFSPKGAVDSWGSEIEDYNDELVGDEKAMVGHYTQIVWRKTSEVGCAAFKCGSALLVVCNYNPAGNWVGEHPYK